MFFVSFKEMEELAKHGITLPPNMMGLTDEQIVELKLKDDWADKCIPSGGSVICNDDIGRRNGMGRYFTVIPSKNFGNHLFLCDYLEKWY